MAQYKKLGQWCARAAFGLCFGVSLQVRGLLAKLMVWPALRREVAVAVTSVAWARGSHIHFDFCSHFIGY